MRAGSGLSFARFFSTPGVSPYDQVAWELRDAIIQDWKGNIIFEQKNVESPVDWSMTATNIVASKYLHGLVGTAERESGVRALITRVAESITDWGMDGGYFASEEDGRTFYAELVHLLLNQKVAFNSPVWFNVGCDRLEPNSDAQNWHWEAPTKDKPGQVVVLDHRLFEAAVQRMLHQLGAGFARFHPDARQDRRHAVQMGVGRGLEPVSSIRGSMETLSGGGTASGPLSVHARFRRLRRRHQVRRQDAPRGQNGRAQCRPPRHRRLHRVQGQGRGQGIHPDCCGI